MRIRDIPPIFFLSLALAVGIGYAAGRVVTMIEWQKTPITVEEDTRPSIPVVRVEGVQGGNVRGTTTGEVRIFLGDAPVGIEHQSFHFPMSALERTVVIDVPEGMQFVASRSGKNYYQVGTPSGEKILPDNRVYFRTEADAEGAGYQPGK